MKISPYSFILATIIATASLSASADSVYRWMDSNGTPHYSKEPPAGVEYQTITTSSVSTVDRGSPEEQPKEEARSRDSGNDKEYSEQLGKLARQQQESCGKARSNRDNLLNNHRIQMRDADGNLRTLSHEEKMEQLKRADEAIQEYCK